MTTPKHKRAGRPRENDGMITRPIAATPEQWAVAEAIGTTYAEGTRRALDAMRAGTVDVSRMTVEQLHELREAIDNRLMNMYRLKPEQGGDNGNG